MNKNIFQEAKIDQMNKFESFKISSECKVRFSGPGDSKKSNKSNNSKEKDDHAAKQGANSILKDDTSPTSSLIKSKKHSRINATPAMYKIALTLKKYTENKFKKVQQDPALALHQDNHHLHKVESVDTPKLTDTKLPVENSQADSNFEESNLLLNDNDNDNENGVKQRRYNTPFINNNDTKFNSDFDVDIDEEISQSSK